MANSCFLVRFIKGKLFKTISIGKMFFKISELCINFLDKSIRWYDVQENCNNFHIKFLIELTRHIGFYPNIMSQEDNYFNLESGSSSTIKPISKFIDFDDYELFKQLLGMKFEDLNYMAINKDSRLRLLNHIIDYYSLHLQMFKSPKSIDILSEIFK